MESLYRTARRAAAICDEALDSQARAKKGTAGFISALEALDGQILHNELKDIAALVFPTDRQLQAIYSRQVFSDDPAASSFQHSRIIYRELQKSISAYLRLLP